MRYGSSQARGDESELQLLVYTTAQQCGIQAASATYIPQLTAMLDPLPTERGQGLNLNPHGC